MNKNTDTILLEVRPHKYVHSTTISPFNRHLKSTKDVEINVKPRDSWDSGEDQYFKWASLNRRPMESLFGRKRVAAAIASRSIGSRVNDDKRLSGLVD
jgi:hypothetical protein